MAASAQQGYSQEHWTAKGGVMGAALLAAVVPLFGLVMIVPCLVTAKRSGTTTTPYVIALALSLVWTVGAYAVQAQIQPS